ncbi:DMSO reductase family type II enzyme, heme b subunit [Thiorhodococcus drewsii AZ1]|uniref:DMSO reductase family type II enzyme, heme b subunit n=1 Tax=Thiorhodococcus drewsii AZ1 TaxID=765913 RepID=G2E456_9GAMM|nr:DMSO reductase family type II enzyme, heme b subunit [Thiorhodococcus drewsii AZ1]
MDKRLRTASILVLAMGLLSPITASLADPNALSVKPGDTIPLTVFPPHVFLRVANDPLEILWERVPEYEVQVVPVPVVHRSVELRKANSGEPMPLFFSVASDGERLYVKLRWHDATPDRKTGMDQSRDGVAVQFTVNADQQTSHTMGAPGRPVNIWYWRSDSESAENLAAGGFGSATHLPEQPVSARSHYAKAAAAEDNQWTVILSRPLATDGEYDAQFEPGMVRSMAFAVWQGALDQRDGLKRTTPGWIKVDLSPLKAG